MRTLFCTTLLCLVGALCALAQPKHYAADYKSPTTPDGRIVVAYVTSNAKAELPDPFVMTHINYAFGHVKERHLFGGMYWEYSCDDAQGTLRHIVADELLK